MRPKTSLHTIKPLLIQTSFTAAQAKALGVSAATLNHYVKSGKLKRIRRGVYQAITYHNEETFQWADLIETVSAIPGGIVCLISALAIYDLTEEIPRQHWIGICHETSLKSSPQVKIVRFRNMELGKTLINLEGSMIPIFDQERTIIDSFRLLSRETAIKALKIAVTQNKHRLDFIKLEAYARKLRVNITPYLLSLTT